MVWSKVQALMREFEILSMKNNEKVEDYSSRFVCNIYNLRDLGENLDDSEVVSRLSRSIPKEYDFIILPLK